MGKAQVMKKVRQLNRRVQEDARQVVSENLPQAAAAAVLEIRQWSLRDRLKFAAWLLWGRGDWAGV